MSLYDNILDDLEKRAYDEMPNMPTKPTSAMYAGAELPADVEMIKMIKANPDALKHYQLAVDVVAAEIRQMSKEKQKNLATQADMARMFDTPSMSDMGTFDEGSVASPEQGQAPADEVEGAQKGSTPQEEEAGPNADIAKDQKQEEAAAEEDGRGEEPIKEKDEMYPFGQGKDKKKKPKKKVSPNSEGEAGPNEIDQAKSTVSGQDWQHRKTASPKLIDLLRDTLLGNKSE